MNYRKLSDSRAKFLIRKFGEAIEIDQKKCLGIYAYPTEEQIALRTGGAANAALVKQKLRSPELHLHKGSGRFKKGQQVTLLDRPGSPIFELAEPQYNEDWIYIVELVEQQPDPVDTKDRKWR